MNKTCLIILSLLIVDVSAQTIKVQPQSCVDHIESTRHAFLESAIASPNSEYREDAMRLYVELADKDMRVRICSSRRTVANYEVMLSMAEYIRRADLVAAKESTHEQ